MRRMSASYVLRQVLSERAERVHEFHKENVGKYLLERDLPTFRAIIDDNALYEVADSKGDPLGISYVKGAEDGDFEFGGVFVAEGHRSIGLADALGFAGISSQLVYAPPDNLIAHVHVANDAPRKLLKRLGFAETGKRDTLPDHIASENMLKDSAGKVVGDVFAFDFSHCVAYADWLDTFNGTVKGPKGTAKLDIELRVVHPSVRAANVATIRELHERRKATESAPPSSV
jgi:hypothetical protein